MLNIQLIDYMGCGLTSVSLCYLIRVISNQQIGSHN